MTVLQELPSEFKAVKWVSWSRRFENYLWQVKGRNNVPLIYVTHKVRGDDAPPFRSEEEQHIYSVTLRGEAYRKDNEKVMQILTQLLADTPAWTWISRFEVQKNGRGAVQALRDHYDGPGEVEKRIAYAYSEIDSSFYKSERIFTFEKYVTKLSEAFEILADHGVAKQEREKVGILLDGIQSDNQIVISAKTTVRMHTEMRTSFQVAVDRLSELIGATMTIRDSKSGRPPSRKVASSQAGKKRKSDQNRVVVNGVDITDPHRNFSRNDWFKIPQEKREWIQKKRAEKKEAKRSRQAASASTGGRQQEQQRQQQPNNDNQGQAQGQVQAQGQQGQGQQGSGNNFGSGAYQGQGGRRQ
jgi:hypothetical protein